MKKRVIRITESQFRKLVSEDGQITITDKISPEGFNAAKEKSKATGSQINVALGTTTNSDGGNGVEVRLDPNAPSTEFGKDIEDAKKTGLETTYVAPIENFGDYNQVRTTSDKVSNISGIDEGRDDYDIEDFNYGDVRKGYGDFDIVDCINNYGLTDDEIDHAIERGLIPELKYSYRVTAEADFETDKGDYDTPPSENEVGERKFGGDYDKVLSLIQNIKDEELKEYVFSMFQYFCDNIELTSNVFESVKIRATKSSIKEARRNYLINTGKVYEKKNLYNRGNRK